MDVADAAPTVGIAACLAVLVSLAAPFFLITDPGTGLRVYYASGVVGAGGFAFLTLLLVVVFLSGKQERSPPATVAGVALVVGVAALALAVSWALAVDQGNLYSFPASAQWITYHRWVVLALTALVTASAVTYARAVL